ncbi:MAG TPA: hypothetical protein VEK33_19285 [Terriglobales bacterium]|nr:hypothetical protein [Terriglobales bacterium]
MQSRTWLVQRSFERRVASDWMGVVRVLSCLLAAPLALSAAEQTAAQMVDKGSFGVFISGKRVATETFSVQQGSSGSSVVSEFLSASGVEKAAQNSELQLSPNGDLKSYEWRETSPGQARAWVLPNQDFLTERFTKTAQDKPQEQPFLLPASTNILDDYFLVQREVLAWRFLATSCREEKGQLSCPLNKGVAMGTLNPHSRLSMLVEIAYSGREKVNIRGTERELIRLDLKTEGGDWALWLNDELKLERILDLTSNTEVVRD